MKKSIQKSVRMTEEVYNYVMKCSGDGFNEKFENMVKLAVESEDQCTFWSDKAEKLKKECFAYQRRVSQSLPYLQNRLNQIKSILEHDVL